jgi:hypothetical protein
MPMLSVAPEGTLSHGRCVLQFKTGAFVAGVPVVPFVLRYKLTPHNPAWTIITPLWHVVRPWLPRAFRFCSCVQEQLMGRTRMHAMHAIVLVLVILVTLIV